MTLRRVIPSGWGFYSGVRVDPTRLSLLQRVARETTSARQMIEVARSAGISIREGAMRAIRREVLGIERERPALSSLRDDFRPGAANVIRTNTVLARRYQYRTRVSVLTHNFGIRDFFVRFTDDSLLTGGDIKARAKSILEQSPDWIYAIGDVEITGVLETAA